MSSKAPPIPPEQRSFRGQTRPASRAPDDRRDKATGLQSRQPGDDDVNLKSQGRYGNRRQNVDTVHFRTQSR